MLFRSTAGPPAPEHTGQQRAVGGDLCTAAALPASSNPLYSERPASVRPAASSLHLETTAMPQLSLLPSHACGDLDQCVAHSELPGGSSHAGHRGSSGQHPPGSLTIAAQIPTGLADGHKESSTLSESFTFSPAPPVEHSAPPPTQLNTLV